ncbi:hypothetical protein ROP_29350 [Rhodococcus opacus B4]|uniref:Uncharacterized protein n=1 Tax=Rhodococcus opacus (strain B4) TaxID=632772 RepID=C1B5Q6_RHOOB|nr:hypothetical protein ROP_29350 [Rhodococcus opacus B4]
MRELVTLPPALTSSGCVTLTRGRGGTCGLDRVGGGTEFVGRDVRDRPCLPRGVGGVPRRSTQVPGRAHGMTARRARLHHLDFPAHPRAGMLDRLTRSWVLGPNRLEQGQNVLRARCRPQGEELVVRVGEGSTAADRHEARVSDLREDHGSIFHHLHAATGHRCLTLTQ